MKGSRAISSDIKAKAAYKHLVMKVPQTVIPKEMDVSQTALQVVRKCPKKEFTETGKKELKTRTNLPQKKEVGTWC